MNYVRFIVICKWSVVSAKFVESTSGLPWLTVFMCAYFRVFSDAVPLIYLPIPLVIPNQLIIIPSSKN